MADTTPSAGDPLRAHDESQLQALFDCMPQLGWAARPDGWIYYYNRRWYEFTGTTPEQMAGWGWQSVHDPERLPLVLERWKGSIETGEPFEMTFPLRRHDGVFRWFLTRVTPMRDAGGTVRRWIGINTDVDDQKRAEEAAAAASRAKDDLLAMVGHELRNPLAPIFTALKLMELKGDDTFARERTIIARQATHMARLVDDLLDVARATRGTLHIRMEPVDVGQVVAQACEMVAPLIDSKKHRLDVDVPAPVTIQGDAGRLKQVVANLLINAAKFTPPGGRIAVELEPGDAEVVLRVRDNGIGIAPSIRTTLFEPFVHRPQPFAQGGGGLGLGLTIVRNIVAAHGGSVDVQSEGEWRGSVFVVRLPVR